MSLPRPAGGGKTRVAPGLRAAWERQQQAAALAAAAGRIPALTRSKPALFAAQLQPVLTALWERNGSRQEQSGEGGEQQRGEQQAADPLQQQQAAVRHLHQLVGLDRHAGANACLLLWLLLLGLDERPSSGADTATASPFLLQLCAAMGWQQLLLEALPLLPPKLRQLVQESLVSAAIAAATSTSGSDSTASQPLQVAVQQLVCLLALRLQQQLQQDAHGTSSTAGIQQQALLAEAELLQQLLLECPAAAPGAASSLQQLKSAADECMAGIMQAMQRMGQKAGQAGQQEQQQALFQQLCQLRARVMLSFAAAGSRVGEAGDSLPDGCLTAPVLALVTEDGGSSQQAPSLVWHAVLDLPPDIPRAAAAAAASGASAALAAAPASNTSQQPSWRQFLAACVAARCHYLRHEAPWLYSSSSSDNASSCADVGGSAGSGSGGGSGSGNGGLPFETTVAALPGVRFQLPLLPVPAAGALLGSKPASAVASRAGSQDDVAAAADAAAAELAKDPATLGPAQLALAALQLAQQVAAGDGDGSNGSNGSSCQQGGEGGKSGGHLTTASPAWRLLLELAAAAAAGTFELAQQQKLLLMVLHGQQAWQRRLRQALAADEELQQRCRRDLVAVTNRLASDVGASSAAVVHGEERRRRTAAAITALLPHALLCPAAVLERLVRSTVQHGGEVDLLLDVLREMRPLAAHRPHQQQQRQQQQQSPPLLLTLLAQLLSSTGRRGQQHVLDVPGSREAYLQLVLGLCGGAGRAAGRQVAGTTGTTGTAVAAATATAAGSSEAPLLSPATVLEQLVVPALAQWQRQPQQQGQEERQAAGASSNLADLLLPLQLADAVLSSSSSSSSGEQLQQVRQLQPLLQGVLDFDGRRIDRSAAALEASPEVFELAASILQRIASSGGSGSSSAGAYFHRQLQLLLLPPAGGSQAQQQQAAAAAPLQQLRRGMVQLLAALLPCCTAEEGRDVLLDALPAAIQVVLLPNPPLPGQQPGQQPGGSGGILPGAHAAAVEAACRAALVLAAQPDQAPIAGESEQQLLAAAGQADAALPAPSALRQVAVERLLQHLTQHCARLAAAGAGAGAGAGPAAAAAAAAAGSLTAKQQKRGQAAASAPARTEGLMLTPAEVQALGLRCYRELCQLAPAVQRTGYDCGTLQAGLLQLVQQLMCGQHAGTPAGPAGKEQQQQACLPLEQVQDQLVAGAEALPAGRLREMVLLAIRQAGAAAD